MSARRIGRHVGGGAEPEGEREARERRERLKDALARWASGVTLVAVRADARVHALTVSGFLPLSVEPPLIAISLGSNASALPYLVPGVEFVVSILRADQRPIAARYADTFPVGPAPFPTHGPPVAEGSLAALVCRVDEHLPGGDHTLVVGRVTESRTGEEGAALAYFQRGYRSIE